MSGRRREINIDPGGVIDYITGLYITCCVE